MTVGELIHELMQWDYQAEVAPYAPNDDGTEEIGLAIYPPDGLRPEHIIALD